MKFIQPSPINLKEVEQDVINGLQDALDGIDLFLETSYSNWEDENQPTFITEVKKDGNNIVIEHWTEDVPYVWVSEGTEGPYPITPKRANFLHFRVGGTPKTFPGRLASGAGKMGTQWRTAAEVTHPGIEPRNFPEEAVKAFGGDDTVAFKVQNRINKGSSY